MGVQGLARRLKMRGVGVRRATPPLLAGTLSPAGERSRRAETMSGPGPPRRREVTLRSVRPPLGVAGNAGRAGGRLVLRERVRHRRRADAPAI